MAGVGLSGQSIAPCLSTALPLKLSRTNRLCVRLARMSNTAASERLPLETGPGPLPPIEIATLRWPRNKMLSTFCWSDNPRGCCRTPALNLRLSELL